MTKAPKKKETGRKAAIAIIAGSTLITLTAIGVLFIFSGINFNPVLNMLQTESSPDESLQTKRDFESIQKILFFEDKYEFIDEAYMLLDPQSASDYPAVFLGSLKNANSIEQKDFAQIASEMIEVARNTISDYGFQSNENADLSYTEWQYIPSQKYVLLIGNSQFTNISQIFEAAVADPSVLDLDDLADFIAMKMVSEEE